MVPWPRNLPSSSDQPLHWCLILQQLKKGTVSSHARVGNREAKNRTHLAGDNNLYTGALIKAGTSDENQSLILSDFLTACN